MKSETNQTFQPWNPVDGLPKCFSGHTLVDDQDGLAIRLLGAGERSDYDLIIRCCSRSIFAYRIHDEFAHPRYNQEPGPKGMYGGHPLWIVHNSEWLRTFNDSQIAPYIGEIVHYFIYTLDHSIDLLIHSPPVATLEHSLPDNAAEQDAAANP